MVGSTGQECFGYRPAMSLRTSAQEPAQNPGRSDVVCSGRPAGLSSTTRSGIDPPPTLGWTVTPKNCWARAEMVGASPPQSIFNYTPLDSWIEVGTRSSNCRICEYGTRARRMLTTSAFSMSLNDTALWP